MGSNKIEKNFIGVTAHRGDSKNFPENTLSAVQSAINLGVDWVEIDVRLTSDRKLVVIHDANTYRVSNVSLSVSKNTYETLQKIDVARSFNRLNNIFTSNSHKVPLLADVFQLIEVQEKVKLSVQPKCNCVKEIIKLASEINVINKIGFNDTSFKKMSLVKRINEKIPVFWDRHPFTILAYDIDTARKSGFEYLVIHKIRVTQSIINKVHSAGLSVGAWTVNNSDDMRKFMSMNVDRLYTDDPQLLLEINSFSEQKVR